MAAAHQKMDQNLQDNLEQLRTGDREAQNQAFTSLIEATEKPVDWAYEVWDEMVAGLSHKDNHRRAIAPQVLCNLAKSDPENRLRGEFHALLEVTKDERFVIVRLCMQALWKVGAAGEEQRRMLVEGLERRFRECSTEKNGTLIRYDILQSLRNVYDETRDESIRAKALELIEIEEDAKYRKKYASLWRK